MKKHKLQLKEENLPIRILYSLQNEKKIYILRKAKKGLLLNIAEQQVQTNN